MTTTNELSVHLENNVQVSASLLKLRLTEIKSFSAAEADAVEPYIGALLDVLKVVWESKQKIGTAADGMDVLSQIVETITDSLVDEIPKHWGM